MVTCGSRALLRPAEEPTLLCAFPLRHQRSMRALAIPLEICNGFKLLRKSDIFIVWGWDSGQPWTIIRGIFLRDVYAQRANLYGIVFSFSFSGVLKRKLDTCSPRQKFGFCVRLHCHTNHTLRGAPFSKSIERRPMRSELRRRAVKWGWHSAHFSLARGRNSQATPSLLCFGSDILNDCVRKA